MKLTYRGIPYQTSIAGTEAPETDQTATFLGQTYKVKRTQVSQRHAAAEFTYRGVRYSR